MTNLPEKTKRSRFRFSIGSMMVLVLILGVLGAWRVNRAKGQRRAVEAIKRLGGSVLYDFQFADGNPDGKQVPNARPPSPAWLRERLGDEFFQEVVQVMITGSRWRDADLAVFDGLPRVLDVHLMRTPNITNAGLVHLGQLRDLRSLDIYRHLAISDDGLYHLRKLLNLEVLLLDGSGVTDAGIDHLLGMKRLEKLDVDRTPVSNAGLGKLKGLPRLKEVYLQNSRATEAGRDDLLKTLPHVKVELGTRPGSWTAAAGTPVR